MLQNTIIKAAKCSIKIKAKSPPTGWPSTEQSQTKHDNLHLDFTVLSRQQPQSQMVVTCLHSVLVSEARVGQQ